MLELISLENIVEKSIERSSVKKHISRELFNMLVLPSNRSLVTSKPRIIVENESISKDILLSVQSQGNGIIAKGNRNIKPQKTYF
jgi:hypothetical protein